MLKFILFLSPHPYLVIQSGFFPSGLQGATLCVFLFTVNCKDMLFSLNIVHLSVFCKVSLQNAVVTTNVLQNAFYTKFYIKLNNKF